MTGPFNKSHIKEGNLQSITSRDLRMHMPYQFWNLNSYSEDQLMHTFLDNFEEGGKYSAQIASHQAELRREEKFPDKNHSTFHHCKLIT